MCVNVPIFICTCMTLYIMCGRQCLTSQLKDYIHILCCFCWFLIEYTLHVALCFQAKPLRHQPPGSHFKVLHELVSPLSAKLLNLDQMLPSMGALDLTFGGNV